MALREDWSNLPLLVVKRIMDFVPRKDQAKVRLVCKRWNTAICNYMPRFKSWTIEVNKLDDLPKDDPVANADISIALTLPADNPGLNNVDKLVKWIKLNVERLKSLKNIGGTLVDKISDFKFSKLCCLAFKGSCTVLGMSKLISNLSGQLEHLSFTFINLTKLVLDHSLPVLHTLIFEQCTGSNCLINIVSKCATSLTHLLLQDFRDLQFDMIAEDLKLVSLKELLILNTRNKQKLRKLTGFVGLIEKCSATMESLHLKDVDIRSINSFPVMICLKKIMVHGVAVLDQPKLDNIFLSCPATLKHISLNYVDLHNVLAQNLEEFPAVTHLSINGCEGDHLQVGLIKKFSKTLQFIDFNAMDIAVCNEIRFKLPCLRGISATNSESMSLSMSSCRNSIDHLVKISAPTLEMLYLKVEDPNLTPKLPIMSYCPLPRLRVLALSSYTIKCTSEPFFAGGKHCIPMTSKLFNFFSQKDRCQSLEVLSLEKLGESSLKFLEFTPAEDCKLPSLKKVFVYPPPACDHVLEKLKTWCPAGVEIDHENPSFRQSWCQNYIENN